VLLSGKIFLDIPADFCGLSFGVLQHKKTTIQRTRKQPNMVIYQCPFCILAFGQVASCLASSALSRIIPERKGSTHITAC
jgi:hypothetical protein